MNKPAPHSFAREHLFFFDYIVIDAVYTLTPLRCQGMQIASATTMFVYKLFCVCSLSRASILALFLLTTAIDAGRLLMLLIWLG